MKLLPSFFKPTRKEQKSSAAGPLIAFSQMGKPRWMSKRYDAMAQEGYAKNVVAYRCIQMLSVAAANAQWQLFNRMIELAEHPLLRLLKRPNPMQGGAAFFESVYAYLQISGNAFIEAVMDDAGEPRELWALRPDRMKIIPGSTGMPEGYIYDVRGQKKQWSADPVTGASPILHLKTFNPLDDWYGQSPLEAAANSIDQFNSAGDWNQALLQNGARPSGALVYQPIEGSSSLSDDQYRRLKEQIDDQYSGPQNAGRPMLLEGGLDWRELSLSPKDMDFINSKHTSARDIALAFGVPSMMLGIPGDNTFSNQREARLAMWEQTILPMLGMMRDELNNWLTPMFGSALELDYDEDSISALTPRRERLWEMVNNSTFLTTNEKREALGYSPLLEGDSL